MRNTPYSGYRQMTWKNGGGTTTEIAILPSETETGEFDWHVSMAQVASDGWFSEFPGVDRTLAILAGNGIHLSVSAAAPVRAGPASDPYSFPADAPAFARLISGPVVDLNIMTRRNCFTHRLVRLLTYAPVTWNLNANITMFLSYPTPSAHVVPKDSAIFENQTGLEPLEWLGRVLAAAV